MKTIHREVQTSVDVGYVQLGTKYIYIDDHFISTAADSRLRIKRNATLDKMFGEKKWDFFHRDNLREYLKTLDDGDHCIVGGGY
jgi:hypothetical protein